jgi:hypothetical protein
MVAVEDADFSGTFASAAKQINTGTARLLRRRIRGIE